MFMSAHRNIIRASVLAGLLCAGLAVHAQQPAAQTEQTELTDEQLAQLAQQDEQMRQVGLQVMSMVDANQVGEIWDGASPVMKNVVPRAEFVNQIAADRSRLGAATGRTTPEITRSSSDGSNEVPAGLYINIASMTSFANQAEPVRELVSFRFDEDQTWRLTGYTLR